MSSTTPGCQCEFEWDGSKWVQLDTCTDPGYHAVEPSSPGNEIGETQWTDCEMPGGGPPPGLE